MAKPVSPSHPLAPSEGVIASSIELSVDNGVVATNVLLLPFGKHYGRDGRGPYILKDRPHAQQVIAATRQLAGSASIMFDYDHQSVLAPPSGGQAKAAGWIDPASLTTADDGIRGDVEWTQAAEAALAAREYRYHSPHFRRDKKTGMITRLVNAGLTNSPNLDLPALASEEVGQNQEEGTDMSRPVLAAALSSTALAALALTAESSDEDVTAAIDQLITDKEAGDSVLASVRTKLELEDDAGEDAVLASIDSAGGQPDPKRFVPKQGYDDLKARVDKLDEDRVLAAVDAAVEAGKIAPSMKDWAIELGKSDEPALQSFIGKAPAFKGGRQLKDDPPGSDKTALSDDEQAICSTMGWDEAEFLEQKKKETE